MTTITPRGEKAKELFLSGYNCSQSVVGAYADVIGLPFDTLMKISLPFGGGFGRMREVCGTFSGAMFVLGALEGDTEHDPAVKAAVYADVQALAIRFKEERSSLICREILGFTKGEETDPLHPGERNEAFYHHRPCGDICALTASLLEELLKEKSLLA